MIATFIITVIASRQATGMITRSVALGIASDFYIAIRLVCIRTIIYTVIIITVITVTLDQSSIYITIYQPSLVVNAIVSRFAFSTWRSTVYFKIKW